MPIYEFQCQTCNQSFEELVRSSESWGEVVCPQCGSRSIRKKISSFNAPNAGVSSSSKFPAICTTGT